MTTPHRFSETATGAGIPRRPLLLGALGLAGASTLAACTGSAQSATPDGGPYRQATHLQIIAHPDDDFYFFNLDMARALQEGHRTVTVCLTAGESDGKNLPRSDDKWSTLSTDYSGYAAARFTGARRTYAQMATGDSAAQWTREAATVGHLTAEKAVLADNPDIVLLYFSLWENGRHSGIGPSRRITDLWSGEASDLPTLPLRDGAVTGTVSLNRDMLVESLVAVLDEYRPDVVRIMDTDPDPQIHDADNPQFAEQDGYSDHIDHTGAAWFAAEALARWLPGRQDGATTVVGYRGYYNQRWPRNLSPEAREEKGRYLDTYAWADGRDCGDPAGCGDLKLPADGVGKRYGGSTIQRHQGSDPALTTGRDGRLHATTVLNGRPTVWTGQVDSFRPWRSRTLEREMPWMPYTSTTVDDQGRVLVAGIEYRMDSDRDAHLRNITVAELADGEDVRWHELGNPAGGGTEHVRDVGVPQVVVTPTGTRMVLVRDHDKGLSIRAELEHGQWTDWRSLGGGDTQDGLSVVQDHADGALMVFAAAADGVRYWRIVDHDEHLTDVLPVDPPAGPVSAVSDRNGRILLIARQAGTSAVVMYQRPALDEEWITSPVILGGNGGIDPVAVSAMRAWDPTLALLHRGDDARLGFTLLDYRGLESRSASTTPEWTTSGPVAGRAPGMALDGAGRLVAAVLGMDGCLYSAHQEAPGNGPLGDWRRVWVPGT